MNNFRTGGVNVTGELIVRFPFTITQEDVVSLVFVNQSVAVNEEMVVFAFRVVNSYLPTDCEFNVRTPPSVGTTSYP